LHERSEEADDRHRVAEETEVARAEITDDDDGDDGGQREAEETIGDEPGGVEDDRPRAGFFLSDHALRRHLGGNHALRLRHRSSSYKRATIDRLTQRRWYERLPTWLRAVASAVLPGQAREWIVRRANYIAARPPVGSVDFGDLRRLEPVSRKFGTDRGRSIDRYYIESFLAAHGDDIRGSVLEIADDSYTRRFGTRVTRSDVLSVDESVRGATIAGDLAAGLAIDANRFDCIILTQTLPFIEDVRAAVRELARITAPGGVVLATMPGISQISRYDMDRWGDYWRFTSLSARRLFADAFGEENVEVSTFGNVLAAAAFLYGLVIEDLTAEMLDKSDADYEVIVAVRARKGAMR